MPKTILVVDDEPSILELVSAIMEGAGYKVLTASNGHEALEIIDRSQPDLVILDMMMPKMTGREVCERIRQNPKTAGLKVAFLTVAQFSETGKDILHDLKILDYITKPFTNADLVKRVKVMLDAN